MSDHIIHSCSSCGRPIQIASSMMGTTVACPHCQASIGEVDTAAVGGSTVGKSSQSRGLTLETVDLMSRVDAALAKVQDHGSTFEPLS